MLGEEMMKGMQEIWIKAQSMSCEGRRSELGADGRGGE